MGGVRDRAPVPGGPVANAGDGVVVVHPDDHRSASADRGFNCRDRPTGVSVGRGSQTCGDVDDGLVVDTVPGEVRLSSVDVAHKGRVCIAPSLRRAIDNDRGPGVLGQTAEDGVLTDVVAGHGKGNLQRCRLTVEWLVLPDVGCVQVDSGLGTGRQRGVRPPRDRGEKHRDEPTTNGIPATEAAHGHPGARSAEGPSHRATG